MNRLLLTIFAAPGARHSGGGGPGIQWINLPDDTAATLDRALSAALAPVALRLGPGDALRVDAAAAARAADRQAHRSWWWASDAPAGPARRVDLFTLLMGHGCGEPVTLFRPGSVRGRGGFGRHTGIAFAYADACARLADGLLPGRVDGPIVTRTEAEEPAALRADRVEVAADFADRCPPRSRHAVWAACAATRAGLGASEVSHPTATPAPLRAAA